MAKFEGNKCLLNLYRIANFGIVLVALGFIAIGCYLHFKTKLTNFFIMSFICFGSFIFLISLFGFCIKNSLGCLKFYFAILTTLLFFQLATTLTVSIYADKIIKWAGKNHSNNADSAKTFEDLIKQNVTIAIYVAVAFASIQVLFSSKDYAKQCFCAFLGGLLNVYDMLQEQHEGGQRPVQLASHRRNA